MRFLDAVTAGTPPATIDALLAAYRRGAWQPAQVLAHLWQRWQQLPSDDAAWITRADAAFIQRQLDALAGRSPDDLPLYGVPFAAKDNIDVQGLPTTAACPDFAYMPEATAESVRRLMAAGAIVVGKTNLDQFATGLVGARSPYGAPTTPFSAEHVSGGSSSGSAVVVARGEVPFALGTDTAGSGRVPAGFNNLVGVKPTPGRIPTHGVVPACRSLDCVSVFALTTGDAARVLAVAEGPMAGKARLHPVVQQLPRLPRALRVGVPRELVHSDDASYAAAFEQARQAWAHLRDAEGEPWPVTLVPVDLTPFLAVARLLYEGPWVAERHAAIDGFMRTQPDAVHPVVRAIIEPAQQLTAVETFQAQYRLSELAAETRPVWDDIDVLMVPTAPTHPTLVSVQADPIRVNALLGTYTNFVNLLGLSALALPAGLTDTGLPFGITLIAPGGSDAALLDVGTCWQQLTQRAPLWGGAPQLGCGLGEATPEALAWPAGVAVEAEPTIALAVVGAHLAGMPLHSQLTERRARLISTTQTAPHYRLYALPGTVPPKPGLARISPQEPASAGHAIALEVYGVPARELGSFLALIPPPLGLGSVELADGSWVKGFICEPAGLVGATDISAHGGWRAYMQHRKEQAA